MVRFITLLLGCVGSLALAQTITVPAQSVTVTIPAQTITVTLPAQSVAIPVTPPVVTPPVVVGPAAGTFWIFNAGTRNSAGDYSFGSGKVTYGKTVVVTGDEGWQPRFPNDDFDTTGYNFVVVSIKPSQQETFQSGMLMIGDKAIPGSNGAVNIMPYGPNPMVVGQWNDYKIPLKLFGNMPTHAYKIMFLGQGVPSPSTNVTEYDKLGFAP